MLHSLLFLRSQLSWLHAFREKAMATHICAARFHTNHAQPEHLTVLRPPTLFPFHVGEGVAGGTEL